MYSKKSGLIIGFHGCDESVRDDVVSKKGILINSSENDYDWLGHGAYFWENNYYRALEFAKYLKDNPKKNNPNHIKNPSVIGAIIDLGYCLDLMDSEYLKMLKEGYLLLKDSAEYQIQIPQNTIKMHGIFMNRRLDCAVIETIHSYLRSSNLPEFDSVRGVFWEGNELYPNAGFREKNHIQIAIRNPNCIKGYFVPRTLNQSFEKP